MNDGVELTYRHIMRVRDLLDEFAMELLERGRRHDATKLKEPERTAFAEAGAKLKGLTYGTPEYDEAKNRLGEALGHHYLHNPHHPEHYDDGIDDMSLVDVVEMFCDWKAASERHDDGWIGDSITENEKRFDMSPQLVAIFRNTVQDFGWEKS